MTRDQMMAMLAENPHLRFARMSRTDADDHTVIVRETIFMAYGEESFTDEPTDDGPILTHTNYVTYRANNPDEQDYWDQFHGGGVGTPLVDRLATDGWELVED
jgi:hypothetical protein